jgi:hypothetical protein
LENGERVRCELNEPPENMMGIRCGLITGPDNYPKGWIKLKTFYYPNGKPVFIVWEKFPVVSFE